MVVSPRWGVAKVCETITAEVNNQNNNGNDLREFVQRAVNVYGNQHLSNTFNQAIYLEGFDAAWQGLYANTSSICKKLQTFTPNKTAETSNDTIFPFTTFTYEFKVQKRGNDSVYNFHNFCLGGTKLLIQRPDKNHYSVVPFAYYISDQITITGGTITLEDIIFNIDFSSFINRQWFTFGGG